LSIPETGVGAVAETPTAPTTPTRKRAADRTKTAPRATKTAWDAHIEELYASWLRRVAAAETGHRVMSDRMRRRYLGLGVPVVVLTTIIGTSAFASLQKTAVPTWVRVAVGSVSIVAAVLSSLQTFLRYGMRSEGHRIAAIRYETLRRDMAKTLALHADARGDPVKELDSVRLRMDRYAKESPTIGERHWERRLAPEFHLSKVPPDPRWGADTVRIPETEMASPAAGDKGAKGERDGR
jgi:hypothetical protein